MAQHDYVIANQSGSAFRADLNNALSATVTGNSGSSAPSSTYAYMIWNDTTSNQRKIRNSANNAWIVLSTLSGGNVFDDDVTFNGASYNLVWDKSDNALEFADNAKCTFGNSDLSINHNGSDSYIDSATGNFALRTTNAGHISIKTNNEYGIFCAANGGTLLYYDGGSAKLETKNYGVTVSGHVELDGANLFKGPDNAKLNLGSSNELQLYFDGTNSIISNTTGMLRFFQPNSNNLTLYADGALSSYGNADSYLLQIHNDGNTVDKSGIRIYCGTDDASGTNYAISIGDGNGTNQGYVTFTGGTVTYGTFTAYHPCIVPDFENPSDSSNAYPYGTLLETISIQYTQKNGADTERGIRYKVKKTQSANSRKVLGAYGGSMNGGPDGQTNEHQALVLGDGHILVNNAGGNIEVGDGICSSATAGIGQKATANPSMIIGIAQEAVTFTGSETKLVAVQYGLQQFIPWS